MTGIIGQQDKAEAGERVKKAGHIERSVLFLCLTFCSPARRIRIGARSFQPAR
jgi:hypothetical protein